LSCALGELAARRLHLSRTWDSYVASNALQYTLRTADKVGYHYRPWSTWIGSRGVRYRINGEGFREDGAIPLDDRPRSAFLGDSVTEGFGVEAGERFSTLAEKMLRKAGMSVACLNFGIASHATVDELRILRTNLAGVKIDAVVLQVGFNDLTRNLEVEAGAPVTSGGDDPANARRWLQQHSALYLALAERYHLALLRRGGTNQLLSSSQTLDEATWQPTSRLLDELHRAAKARGASLVVFYSPLDVEVQSTRLAGHTALGSRLSAFCERRGIRFVDVVGAAVEARREGLYLDDVHLTRRGHEVVASALLKPLREALTASREAAIAQLESSPEVSSRAGERVSRHRSQAGG